MTDLSDARRKVLAALLAAGGALPAADAGPPRVRGDLRRLGLVTFEGEGDERRVILTEAGRAALGPAPAPSGATANKTQLLKALVARQGGATLAELQAASGWQAHSIRGFLSGTIKKKMKLQVVSAKEGAGRRYSLGAAAQA